MAVAEGWRVDERFGRWMWIDANADDDDEVAGGDENGWSGKYEVFVGDADVSRRVVQSRNTVAANHPRVAHVTPVYYYICCNDTATFRNNNDKI